MDKLSTTIEDYLSLMYVLERDNEPVVGVHLAELLGVTPPTVTNTLKRMSRDGLIVMDKKGTRLTKTGRESARTVQEVLPFNQTVTLKIEGKVVTLGFASASYVFFQVSD